MRNPYNSGALHKFTRKCACTIDYVGNAGFSNSGSTGQSLSFAYSLGGTIVFIGSTNVLTAPLGSGDFTTLFDQYRIDAVSVQILPNHNSATMSATAGPIPTLYIVKDYDDSNALPSLAATLEYGSCKAVSSVFRANPPRFSIRPRILTQTYRSASTTGYAPAHKATWLDSLATDVPHYGTKMWTGVTSDTNTYLSFTFVFTYYLSCKFSI